MSTITLSYVGEFSRGLFSKGQGVPNGAWVRLRNAAIDIDHHASITSHKIEVSWPTALTVLRTLAPLQGQLGFDFDTDETSAERIAQFMRDYKAVRSASGKLSATLSTTEIENRLSAVGWNSATHGLKTYQLENLQSLLALSNGANFSVPGAGKTTVSFALHLLLRENYSKLIIVAPRNAFPAWESVVDECLNKNAPMDAREQFLVLSGGESRIEEALRQNGNRFIISYDQLVRVDSLIERYLALHRTHLILDESHRMKAGAMSLRGLALLRMGHLANRRDILSGTPMPQSSTDLQSQLDFLHPGIGLGSRISTGEAPRSVLGNLYVRTTKKDLDLPDRKRQFIQVSLTEAHLAFYAVLKEDFHAQASALRRGPSAVALINARRSIVRLLQAAVNPGLVVESLQDSVDQEKAGLLRAVINEGPSNRVLEAVSLAERLVANGKKILIWTIFTSTINQLKSLLAHMQPALIYGQIGMGSEDDDDTRQGQIRRFKNDPACQVMIANPAAASEGISLHMHCHDAIYVDRSYNATHFLQSIDRIHRLGLSADVETTIYVLQNKLPPSVGSIDLSVSRRLATKIRNMEMLLADPDLHELALDEESAPGAIEQYIDAKDIEDLVAELEGKAVATEDEDFI